MRTLVTGGGGFVGSHVSEALVAAGHEVRIVDRDPSQVVAGAHVRRVDLNDDRAAAEAVDGIDVVCHQAARVGLGVDFCDAPSYVADNDLATARLLAALAARRFSGRLVLASSMVVYGEGGYRCGQHGPVRPGPRDAADLRAGRFEPTCPACLQPVRWQSVPETARLDPRSVYAASKLAQEHLCAIWARETGASVVALRYHNVYGPRLPLGTPYAGVAALFRDRLRQGLAPLVFEDGGQTRDFVHVADVAAANLAALSVTAPAGAFEPVNICSGRPVTILEVASALAGAFGSGAPGPVVTGQFRLGDVRHIVASPERAATWLGFGAGITLADGLAELAEEPVPSGHP